MSEPPVDQDTRRSALDPSRSYIVQAPAGSGKTGLLVGRYLRLLSQVEKPEQILAITFTNKAALEMRERVLGALRNTKLEQPEGYEGELWALAKKVLLRDRAQGWDIEINHSRLKIQTIDSFYNYLVSNLPILAGFGSAPRISDDVDSLYREAVRDLVQLPKNNPDYLVLAQTLEHLDNSFAKLQRLLIGMLRCRDQWLRHIGQVDNESGFAEALQNGLRKLQESGMRALESELARLGDADTDCWAELMDWSSGQLQRNWTGGLPAAQPENFPQWLDIIDRVLTGAGDWRKAPNAKQGFPPPSEKGISAEQAALRKSRKEQLQALLSGFAGRDSLKTALLLIRQLPAEPFRADELRQITSIARVLRLAVAHLKLVFQRHGQVDHTEVALAASLALGGPGQPTDLALALDYRIQHILVDEFQDTSHQQYTLLEKLTEGWSGDDGRSLFLVGDPMQSIYRFREAEVGLFLRTRRHGLGQLQPIPLTLRVNFRSQAALVTKANELFRAIFPARESIASGAVAFAPALPHRPRIGEQALTYHFSVSGDDRVEAQRVVALIERELAMERSPDSIAVLARSKRHLAEIVPALRAAGIPFQGVELETLDRSPWILDLVVLTRCLLQPADRVAWLALLRAPWCGLTLVDLTRLARSVDEGGNRNIDLQSVLRAGNWPQDLSEDARARLQRVRQALEPVLGARGEALHRRVEALWLALSGPATLPSVERLEDCRAYFDLLASMEDAGKLDGTALRARLEKLHAAPGGGTERVHLMTMHKSKGLEFDSVIIPGLHKTTRSNEKPLLAWLDRVSELPHSDLLLAPIPGPDGVEHQLFTYIKTIKDQQSVQEDIRLLYVAVTRARQRVHLLGNVMLRDGALQQPDPRSLLHLLWPDCETLAHRQLAEQGEANDQALDEGAPPRLLHRLPSDWQQPRPAPDYRWQGADVTPEQEPDKRVFDWAGEVARQVGIIAHTLLQRLGELGESGGDLPRSPAISDLLIVSLLTEAGVPAGHRERAAARVRRILSQVLRDERGRWILRAGRPHSAVELRLGGILNGRLINQVIDRTFVEDGVRWIIDYKTGFHEGSGVEQFLDSEQLRYRDQLEGYARLIQHLGDEPIRLGLYYPAFGGWREWDFSR